MTNLQDLQDSLDERARHLLKALVEQYVLEGKPVGSRILARDAGLKLSPATVRNVMADLEDLGLVTSPHTSAGRMPTVKGYRVFVDSLLTLKPLEEREIYKFQSELNYQGSTPGLISKASDLLSSITQMAGVVMIPRVNLTHIAHVEFLNLSEDKVLSILVHSSGEVHNRVIHTQRQYSSSELQQAANYLTQALKGKSVNSVRETLLEEMREARESMNEMMLAAIEMANQALQDPEREEDYILAGETNLMDFQELSDVHKLRNLFEAFSQKRDFLHLLDQSMGAEGIQIFIGNESGYEAFDDCSVITTSYECEGELAGVLGVIGPTRMPYDRVIPIVDVTAKLLSAALKQRQ